MAGGRERVRQTLESNPTAQQAAPVPAGPDPFPHAGIRSVHCFLNRLHQSLEHIRVRGGGARLSSRREIGASGSVGDIVQTVHRRYGGSFVEEVHQDESRLAATVSTLTLLRSIAEIARAAGGGISRAHIAYIWVLNVEDGSLVKKVIHKGKPVGRKCSRQVILHGRWAVGCTREIRRRGHIVGVLPEVGELVHQVWSHRVARGA